MDHVNNNVHVSIFLNSNPSSHDSWDNNIPYLYPNRMTLASWSYRQLTCAFGMKLLRIPNWTIVYRGFYNLCQPHLEKIFVAGNELLTLLTFDIVYIPHKCSNRYVTVLASTKFSQTVRLYICVYIKQHPYKEYVYIRHMKSVSICRNFICGFVTNVWVTCNPQHQNHVPHNETSFYSKQNN